MKINTRKNVQSIKGYIPSIQSDIQLYFGFSSLCDCRDSQRILNAQQHKKTLLNSLLDLTKFFKEQNDYTLDIKGKQAPKDYKQLKGKGIEGYLHKFKLNGAVSVLVDEQPDRNNNRLLINVGKIGDFHD